MGNYMLIECRDKVDDVKFLACVSIVRYVTFKKEIVEGERPHLEIVGIKYVGIERNEGLKFSNGIEF